MVSIAQIAQEQQQRSVAGQLEGLGAVVLKPLGEHGRGMALVRWAPRCRLLLQITSAASSAYLLGRLA